MSVMNKRGKELLRDNLLLYAVTDRAWCDGKTLKNQVLEAIEGGITFLQLREKDLEEEEFLQEAIELGQIAKDYNIPFVINDNVEIAIKSGADGVHVGQKDMQARDVRGLIGPNKILGVSVQTVEQAILAQESGADYLGVGAVFPTGSKNDADDVSYDTLKTICEVVDIPVVAIGGITGENVVDLAGSHISGVAVISAIFGQEDIVEATRCLKDKVRNMVENKLEGDLYKVLTIAGSDCSGGAGIQADIKTITANKAYAMSVITALTAQNTMGVYGIYDVSAEFVGSQLDCIFTDIVPDAVKIGMVSNGEVIDVIANRLKYYKAKNIVVDPVMISTSGSKLIADDAINVLKEELFPLATVITPNIAEACALTGISIESKEEMIEASKIISEKYNCVCLCKGGHSIYDADDLLYFKNGRNIWLRADRVDNENTHGTGCTLSSAIATNLAKGMGLEKAVKVAKDYVLGAINTKINIGKGKGPLNHMYKM